MEESLQPAAESGTAALGVFVSGPAEFTLLFVLKERTNADNFAGLFKSETASRLFRSFLVKGMYGAPKRLMLSFSFRNASLVCGFCFENDVETWPRASIATKDRVMIRKIFRTKRFFKLLI